LDTPSYVIDVELS